jgi:molecular chaperone GrpE
MVSVPEDKKSDPLATQISQEVIAEALQSVERRAEAGPAATPKAEDGADPKELEGPLIQAQQALRQREAELEASQALGRKTQETLKEQHERTLRALADLENYKKRAARERDEAAKYSQEKLLRELLPVADSLDRALGHSGSAGLESLLTGIRMTRKLLVDAFAKVGVQGFSALDTTFDPTRHEAMQALESDAAPGTVIEEMARGYTLHERLLRPAMVVVAKPKAGTSNPPCEGGRNQNPKDGERAPD